MIWDWNRHRSTRCRRPGKRCSCCVFCINYIRLPFNRKKSVVSGMVNRLQDTRNGFACQRIAILSTRLDTLLAYVNINIGSPPSNLPTSTNSINHNSNDFTYPSPPGPLTCRSPSHAPYPRLVDKSSKPQPSNYPTLSLAINVNN